MKSVKEKIHKNLRPLIEARKLDTYIPLRRVWFAHWVLIGRPLQHGLERQLQMEYLNNLACS